MPRYHLNIRNGSGYTPDEEGQELAGIDQARATAILGIRSMLAAEVEKGTIDLRGRIEVTDPQGQDLLIVEFRDAVSILQGELRAGGGEDEAAP